MLDKIVAHFKCDECGKPFSVTMDPAHTINASIFLSVLDIAIDAVRRSEGYEGLKTPAGSLGLSLVDEDYDDKHLCGYCASIKCTRYAREGRNRKMSSMKFLYKCDNNTFGPLGEGSIPVANDDGVVSSMAALYVVDTWAIATVEKLGTNKPYDFERVSWIDDSFRAHVRSCLNKNLVPFATFQEAAMLEALMRIQHRLKIGSIPYRYK